MYACLSPPPSRLGAVERRVEREHLHSLCSGSSGSGVLQNFEMRCGPAHDKYPGQIFSADNMPSALSETASRWERTLRADRPSLSRGECDRPVVGGNTRSSMLFTVLSQDLSKKYGNGGPTAL